MITMIPNPETLTEQLQNLVGYIVQALKAIQNTIANMGLEELQPMDPHPIDYFKEFYKE